MTTKRRFDNQKFTALIQQHGPPEAAALYTKHTKESIVGYMKGRAIPPTQVLLELCEYLDCEPGDLLVEVDGADELEPEPPRRPESRGARTKTTSPKTASRSRLAS